MPKMDTNPRGIFRKGGQIRVWLAQDEHRLPVRFEVKVRVGTAVGLLTSYTPAPEETEPSVTETNDTIAFDLSAAGETVPEKTRSL